MQHRIVSSFKWYDVVVLHQRLPKHRERAKFSKSLEEAWARFNEEEEAWAFLRPSSVMATTFMILLLATSWSDYGLPRKVHLAPTVR